MREKLGRHDHSKPLKRGNWCVILYIRATLVLVSYTSQALDFPKEWSGDSIKAGTRLYAFDFKQAHLFDHVQDGQHTRRLDFAFLALALGRKKQAELDMARATGGWRRRRSGQ